MTRVRSTRHTSTARLAAVAMAAVMFAGVSCHEGDNGPPPLRLWTDDLAFRVSANPAPPPARENVLFRVVVRDKKSGQAIERGEGRVYAENGDHIKTWDGLTADQQQPGTYTAKLNFLTSGDWQMGMQFRRDSTRPIETLDWTQTVNPANGEAPIR
jgi:hypothetical protein